MQSVIKGRKSGSSNARTPVESPDSIQSTSYAKILLALGEGEFKGGLDGTRIFLDGTPITDANGNANFSGVTWEFRPGTPDQSYIPGFPGVENEITVSTELTSQAAWVRSLTNTQLSAARLRFSWSALQQQQDNGDVGGYRVEYAIDVATDGGSYQELLKTAVDGKTTTKYERSHRIDLPKANTGWQIRVRRITPNSTSNRIADRMVIEAITEVIDAKLRYPETALLFVQFDAKQFQNIPVVSCEPDGRIIRIPSNYDPVARSYSGTWEGSFKWAWTNNPAWIYYDIQISERFGLGNRIKAENLALTKWDLYRIAQYCDQLVPDGRGGSGTEPRFLCDVYIQSQEEAWTVLNDLAAIFRGATFWANNQMNVIADMPRDIDYIVTRANVKDGKFTYSNASEKTHYSQAMVAWSDPDNGYQDSVESVSDNKLVIRYGIKQADVTAIGCTRQTEAIRRGKWILHTNDADRAISYTMGLDGDIPAPGSIVGVADALLAGRPLGGRINAVDGRNITLDRVSSAAVGERLIINMPSGKAQGRTIEAVNDKIITVTTEYSETPIPESVWAVDATDLALQLYRVIGVAEGEDGASSDITGIQYDPDKWPKIDTGARIESRPISVIPPSVQPAPANVAISSYNTVDQGINITTLRVTWDRAESAIAYEAQWRRDNGNWINAARTSALGFEVSGIYAGQYQARVRAINASEISSMWANAQETTLHGKEGNPPALASFTTTPLVFGIQLDWAFPADTADTLKTEIQYSPTNDGQNALLLADVAYPARSYQQMGLSIGQEFFYRARIVDKSGNQGPWTDWTHGESSTDVSDITDIIVKEVTETDAWKSLVGELSEQGDLLAELKNNADILARGVIENGLNVAETRKQLNNAVESIRTNITNTRAELEATDAYLTQLVDSYIAENDGRVAQVINDVTLVKNEQEIQAQELDAVVAKADGNAALIASETTARISGDEANAQEIATTRAQVADNTGRITSAEQAQATTDSAVASIKQDIVAQAGRINEHDQSISHLTTEQQSLANQQETTASSLTGLTSEFNTNKANVNQSLQTLATNDAAQTQMINGLRSDTDSNNAAITELSETVAGQGSSTASVKQSLDAQARAQLQDALNGSEEAQQRRQNVARITRQQEVQASEQQSLARDLTQLETEFNGQLASTNAALQAESLTRSTETAALSQQTNALSARLNDAESDIAGTASGLAATQASVTQQGDKITSQGQSINQMSATINGVSGVANDAQSKANANATTLQQTNATVTQHGNALTAQATQISQMTVTVNGVSAEISDVSSLVNGMDAKMSAYRSIKVAVDANGRQYIAGIGLDVSNSQDGMQANIIMLADRFTMMTTAGGVPTPIFTNQGTQVILRDVVIGEATIGFAKMKDDLQSSALGAGGQPLWKLNKGGELIMVGPNTGDGYLTIKGNLLQVFDGKNRLRIKLGVW